MFWFIDKWIESWLKTRLHQKREHYISQSILLFQEKFPSQDIGKFKTKLNAEADRVYTMADRSILRERIYRAKYNFWMSLVTTTIIVGAVVGFNDVSFSPFVAPFATGFAAYWISFATITVSYNQRIKGGLDSLRKIYEIMPTADPVIVSIPQLLRLKSLEEKEVSFVIIHDDDLAEEDTLLTDDSPVPVEEVKLSIPPTLSR